MRTFVTVDDYLEWTGAEPYTSQDLTALGACCAAVSGFINRVRPDLRIPDTVTVGGQEFSALAGQKDPARASADEGSVVAWAALQLVKRWAKANTEGEQAAFQSFGFLPVSIDKDIEAALRIGREARPVIA